MSRKWSLILIDILGVYLTTLGLSLLIASPASAQCGDNPPKSSCVSCHIEEDPVYEKGAWHVTHARRDCCTNCHGGNCSTMDKTLAHEGLVANPLNGIYTNCHSCHPDDYQALAGQYALELGVTVGSGLIATPVPSAPFNEQPIVILPPDVPNTSSFLPWPMALGGLGFAVLLILTLSSLYIRLRVQR